MVNVLPENDTDCRAVCLSRRVVVTAAAGGAAAVLAGCSTYGDDGADAGQSVPETTSTAPDGAAAEEGAEEGGEETNEVSLASLEDVPVGGGLILEDEGIVLTQPTEGKVRAFTTKCTHQGCAVSEVTDGNIVCTCHGSTFDIADGSVTDGPAKKALKKVNVKVDGDKVLKA